MSELPNGWVQVELKDVVDKIVGGGTPSKSIPSYYEGEIPWMTVKDMNKSFLTDTVDHITAEAVENSSTNVIPAGVPIIATRMSLGKIVRASFDSAINQDLKALFVSKEISQYFFEYWYRSQAAYIESLGTGTTVKGVRLEVINGLQFSLAPIVEQKRIVEKLDELLSQVDTIKAHLDNIPSILKRFRQSLLATAVAGQLTEDWRGQTECEQEFLKGWKTVTLGEYVLNLDGARRPVSSKERALRRGDFPYFGATGQIDSIDGYTHDGEFVLVGEDGANLLTRVKPLSFVTNGKVWVNNHAHVIQAPAGHLNQYLSISINILDIAPWVSGSAQPKLNQKNMNKIPLCIPPVAEQSIFKKAFRGELVPQDPSDEPASVLLERIAESRKEADALAKAAKKKAKPSSK